MGAGLTYIKHIIRLLLSKKLRNTKFGYISRLAINLLHSFARTTRPRIIHADYLHTETSGSHLVKMFAFTLKMKAYDS
jgi:hypothetical protein